MTRFCFMFSLGECAHRTAFGTDKGSLLDKPVVFPVNPHDPIPRISDTASVIGLDLSVPARILFSCCGSGFLPSFTATSEASHCCVLSMSISFFFTSLPKSVIVFHLFSVDKHKNLDYTHGTNFSTHTLSILLIVVLCNRFITSLRTFFGDRHGDFL